MATQAQLIAGVQDIIQDDSFAEADILKYLNRGVQEIAAGIPMPSGLVSPPLPDLHEIGTVDTAIDAAYVSLPAAYQRKVFFVASGPQNRRIPIYDSFHRFVKKYPLLNETGDVEAVAVKGRALFYQPAPSTAETLTLHFYRKPVDMADADDTPEGIPEAVQFRLLTTYAAREIFRLIEDGIEGPQVNTARYEGVFYRVMEELARIVGAEDGEPQYIGDDCDYTDWW